MEVKVTSAVPNGSLRRTRSGDGTWVAVASVEGRLYGVDDTCTHEGCSLSDGRLDGTTVTCPCHGSQFDVTSGEVLRGPAEDPVGTWAVVSD